jgi:hypothetical protein
MFGHQVAIHVRARVVDPLGDPLQDDRAHRDRLHEVAVSHVEVEDPHACTQQDVDLFAEASEVRRVQRRLDLHRSCPVVPAHADNSKSTGVR